VGQSERRVVTRVAWWESLRDGHGDPNRARAANEEDVVIARVASFEGGDAEEMRRLNNEMLVNRSASLPAGLLRVMVLMTDDSRWSVVSFFADEESARASEARFEEMGDEIPESVRGKRVSLETYEVAFDVEMVGAHV
jgi:hypothetical protein